MSQKRVWEVTPVGHRAMRERGQSLEDGKAAERRESEEVGEMHSQKLVKTPCEAARIQAAAASV